MTRRHSKHILNTPRWRALRMEVLRRDDWQCLKCGARHRLEVDHIEPVRTAPEQAWELSNLQTLCAGCHTRKTRIDIGSPEINAERRQWRDLMSKPFNKGE